MISMALNSYRIVPPFDNKTLAEESESQFHISGKIYDDKHTPHYLDAPLVEAMKANRGKTEELIEIMKVLENDHQRALFITAMRQGQLEIGSVEGYSIKRNPNQCKCTECHGCENDRMPYGDVCSACYYGLHGGEY